MDIPAEYAIDQNIRKGSVYYFVNDSISSSEPHYHIVLNENPKEDPLLILAISSSQIENVKRINRNNPPETIVEISPGEYPAFTKNSIIDCNSPRLRNKEQLKILYSQGKLKLKREMDPALVNLIIQGVLKSKAVPKHFKEILQMDKI